MWSGNDARRTSNPGVQQTRQALDSVDGIGAQLTPKYVGQTGESMRPGTLVLVAALLAVTLVPGCSARPISKPVDDSAEPATTSVTAPDAQPLMGYELPLDVASLEASLGKPDSIQRPAADDPSPWGQMLTWDKPDGTTFRALADDYSPTSTDSGAGVGFIELRAAPLPDSGDTEATPIIYGFVLNETSIQEVDGSLSASVPSMMHDRPELDPDDVYHATILYEQGGLYTYFFFSESGMLVGVGQAIFPIDGAD